MNNLSIMDIAALLLFIFMYIALGIMMGSRISNIRQEKGYDNPMKWFWIGFFLWPFEYRSTILAPVVNEVSELSYDENNETSYFIKKEYSDTQISPDQWQCRRCCKWNRHSLANCANCGTSKTESIKMMRKVEEQIKEAEEKKLTETKEDE